MTATRRSFSVCLVVFSCLAVLFSATAIQAETITDIAYTEKAITIKPISGFKNISVDITNTDGSRVFSKPFPIKNGKVSVSDFNSSPDGWYNLIITAETGKINEVRGRKEDGREAKAYHLKETVTQSDTFQIINKKIHNSTIIEE